MGKLVPALVLVGVGSAGQALAQPADLTPEAIREAISFSEKLTAPNQGEYSWKAADYKVIVQTPYRRVVEQAFEARRKHIPYAERDVRPDQLAGVIVTVVFSGGELKALQNRIDHIVVIQPNGTAVQPISIGAPLKKYVGRLPYARDATYFVARDAVFPTTAFVAGAELRIVRDHEKEVALPFTPGMISRLR